MIREQVRVELAEYLHGILCDLLHDFDADHCPYFDLRPASFIYMAEEVALHMHDGICPDTHPYSDHVNDPDGNPWLDVAQQIVKEIAESAIETAKSNRE